MIKKIWLLDDDELFGSVFYDVLIAMTFSFKLEITVFSRSAPFLEALKSATPDLVFLDLNIKESISGAEIAQRMSPHIPKILLSGYIPDSLNTSLFNEIIEKPFSVKEMSSVIKRY